MHVSNPQISAGYSRRPSRRVTTLALRGLLLLIVCFSQPVQAQRWPDEHMDGPFVYHADFQLRPFYPLLKTVSKLEKDVPKTLGLDPVDERIHLFLFEKHRTYQTYVKKYFPTVPNRPALFVKQRGPGMVFARLGNNIAIDLRHETTHAVLHSVLPMVPLWLDEGLGEYFEMPAETRAWQHPHLQVTQRNLRSGAPSIEQLEKLGDLSEMNSEHYRMSWSWVHFMLHGPHAAKQALQAYLRDVAAHVPPGDLSLRLRRSVPNLEREYVSHFRKWRSR